MKIYHLYEAIWTDVLIQILPLFKYMNTCKIQLSENTQQALWRAFKKKNVYLIKQCSIGNLTVFDRILLSQSLHSSGYLIKIVNPKQE